MQLANNINRWLKQQKALQKRVTNHRQQTYSLLLQGTKKAGQLAMAEQLAKTSGKELYRVDLSQLVSKYIGETEKNLAVIFKEAERKNWILFFDEADALFGKRTDVKDSHDRYANREINVILDRLQKFPGIVIVASSSKQSIDKSFTRRFTTVVKTDDDSK